MTCHGVTEYVICGGRVCVDEGQVKVLQGYGKYISNPPFAPFVYDEVAAREVVRLNLKCEIRNESKCTCYCFKLLRKFKLN